MTELEAARVALAGLNLLRDNVPDGTTERLASILSEAIGHMGRAVHHLEQAAPPWNPEPAPATPRPWSQVSPGDEVQAPNGQWYPVDSWARIGEQVRVLLVGVAVPSIRNAKDVVPTRRGAAGKAADIFRAGGLDLEQLGTEKAA